MRKKMSRKCEVPNCMKMSSYGSLDGPASTCPQHRREGFIDHKHKLCDKLGCIRHPYYGIAGEKVKFCSTHKTSEMINLRNRRCRYPRCDKQPSYGYDGKGAVLCAEHKEHGMTDVVSRLCEYPGCRIHRNFAFPGETARFCNAHKLQGMINVKNTRCNMIGCSRLAICGLVGSKAVRCTNHKTTYMVDVRQNRCKHSECTKHPSFAYEGEQPTVCQMHKEPGMIGVNKARGKSQNPLMNVKLLLQTEKNNVEDPALINFHDFPNPMEHGIYQTNSDSSKLEILNFTVPIVNNSTLNSPDFEAINPSFFGISSLVSPIGDSPDLIPEKFVQQNSIVYQPESQYDIQQNEMQSRSVDNGCTVKKGDSDINFEVYITEPDRFLSDFHDNVLSFDRVLNSSISELRIQPHSTTAQCQESMNYRYLNTYNNSCKSFDFTRQQTDFKRWLNYQNQLTFDTYSNSTRSYMNDSGVTWAPVEPNAYSTNPLYDAIDRGHDFIGMDMVSLGVELGHRLFPNPRQFI